MPDSRILLGRGVTLQYVVEKLFPVMNEDLGQLDISLDSADFTMFYMDILNTNNVLGAFKPLRFKVIEQELVHVLFIPTLDQESYTLDEQNTLIKDAVFFLFRNTLHEYLSDAELLFLDSQFEKYRDMISEYVDTETIELLVDSE